MVSETRQSRCSVFAFRLCILFIFICACIFGYVFFSASLSPIEPTSVNMSVLVNATRTHDLTNWTDVVVVNETAYGCGNARFTVQEWSMVNLPIAVSIMGWQGDHMGWDFTQVMSSAVSIENYTLTGTD